MSQEVVPPANALGVASYALLNDGKVSVKDKDLLEKFEVIKEVNEEDKILVNRFLDLTIGDFRTNQAYTK